MKYETDPYRVGFVVYYSVVSVGGPLLTGLWQRVHPRLDSRGTLHRGRLSGSYLR